jgi:hypothetical protein
MGHRSMATNRDEECCNNIWQQLLAIWRNAKGKERDALLWGDEVDCHSELYQQGLIDR